ncbi:uncharacterized protein LOC131424664 [Marmota monax]|uniref:uncharacterized protein LOC131424664 n=1 Tax=Marmota monax TaxID=9995 RepID=UPI0026EB4D7E|nr:uncharacterized protein LOC131424664 [Marmota monax]
MSGIQLKIIRQTKKQENVSHNEKGHGKAHSGTFCWNTDRAGHCGKLLLSGNQGLIERAGAEALLEVRKIPVSPVGVPGPPLPYQQRQAYLQQHRNAMQFLHEHKRLKERWGGSRRVTRALQVPVKDNVSIRNCPANGLLRRPRFPPPPRPPDARAAFPQAAAAAPARISIRVLARCSPGAAVGNGGREVRAILAAAASGFPREPEVGTAGKAASAGPSPFYFPQIRRGRQAGGESYAPARRGLKPVGQPGALPWTGGSEVGGQRRLWVPGTRAGEGCRVAQAARPQPPPLPAQLLTDGAGEGVILHIPYPAPPPASIKLGAGGSSAFWLAPIGLRSLLLWRDWLWLLPGLYDVTSAIRFVGRGDLGLGGWDEGVKVGSAGGGTEREGAGGRAGAGSLPLLRSAESRAASVLEQLLRLEVRRCGRPWKPGLPKRKPFRGAPLWSFSTLTLDILFTVG